MYNNDLLILASLGAGVFATAFITERLSRSWLKQWIARKLLHVIAVGACAAAPLAISSDAIPVLSGIVGLALLLLIYLVNAKKFFTDSYGQKSWGIVWFPLAFLILLIIFPKDPMMVALPMGFLALGDAFACIIGTAFSPNYYILFGDKKSWVGNLAFISGALLSSAIIIQFTPFQLPTFPTFALRNALLFTAVVAAAVEAMSSKGFDNFTVPLSSALILYFLREHTPAAPLWAIYLFPLLALPFAYLTSFTSSLQKSGAFAAVFLGWMLCFFGGFIFLIPPLFFLCGSVLIAKLIPQKKINPTQNHELPRDHLQVWCNGLIFLLLIALYAIFQLPSLLFAAAVSMGMACADTWSSEVGTRIHSPTIDILNFRKINPGVSGGVSFYGTLAALIAAILFAILWDTLFDLNEKSWILLVSFSFLGMLIDSILGAGFQKKYITPQLISDQPLPGAHKAGISWLGNNGVNIISQIITALLAIFV